VTNPNDESEEQAYFRAIEETFIRLRGAPLLLSPADWRIAQTWRRDGVPFDLVQETLETLFRLREERGAKGKVQSLRYCQDAVETAWEELQELVEPARREEPEALDSSDRVAALADSLPSLPTLDRLGLRERILALSGSVTAMEAELRTLERELYDGLVEDLEDEEREELERRVAGVLNDLPEPLELEERALAADRLRRQILRRRLELPYLTLLS